MRFANTPGVSHDDAKVADAERPTYGSVAEVYRAHQALVWRSLHHLGLPKSVLNDATQDVFLVVHRRFQDYDGRASMSSWLYGIARKVASEYRKGRRHRGRHLELVSNPDARESGEADAPARVAVVSLIESFLGLLDDDKRRTFLLAEVEGMTAPEIATAEGVNLNTVYGRIRAARRKLANAVARHQRRTQRSEGGQ